MMTRLIAAVALLLAAAVALADLPHDAVCNVSAPPYGGSGTLVGYSDEGSGIVITAAHVIDEGDQSRMSCRFTNGRCCRAKLLGRNAAYDIAALDVESPPNMPTPSIVVARKEDGPYTAVGYPWDKQGRQAHVTGAYLGYPGRGESAWARSMLHTRTHVYSGYSGGARFNRYGEYVGVVSGMTGDGGSSMDRTWGCAGPALIQFVGQWVEVDE